VSGKTEYVIRFFKQAAIASFRLARIALRAKINIRPIMPFIRIAIVLIAIVFIGFCGWWIHLWIPNYRLIRAIRDAGYPTSTAETDRWYPSVPAEKNAALVMTQAFALMQKFPYERSNDNYRVAWMTPARGERFTEPEQKLIEEYLALNSTALAKARAALKLTNSHYGIDFSRDVGPVLTHVGKLKEMASLARLEAVIAAEAGRTSEAATDVVKILELAATLNNEPIMISYQVRLGIIWVAASTVENCLALAEFREQDSAGLATAFSLMENPKLKQRALIGDRAAALSAIRKYRFLVEPDLNFYLKGMATNIAFAGLQPPESLAITNFANGIEEQARLTSFGWDAASPGKRLALQEARTLGKLRSAQTALAIRNLCCATVHDILGYLCEATCCNFHADRPNAGFGGRVFRRPDPESHGSAAVEPKAGRTG